MIFRGNRPRFCPRLKQREGKGQERCFRVFHIRRRRKSMNHRSVVWTRPKAKSPRALAGSWIVTGRHTSPVTRSLLSSPSQPCARAHKVSSVNNLTRRIFHRSPVSSSIDRRNRSGEGSTQAYDVFGQIETWIAIDRGKRASKVSYESLSSIFEMMYSFLLKFFSPLLAINRGNDLRSLENERV